MTRKKMMTIQVTPEINDELNEVVKLRQLRVPAYKINKSSIVSGFIRRELLAERKRAAKG